MRYDYIELNGVTYHQGTIFVFNRFDGVAFREKRTIFLYHDTDKQLICFITPNDAGRDSCTYYRSKEQIGSFVRTEQPTREELMIAQQVLQRDGQQKHASKKTESSDLDLFFFIILLIISMAVFPPAALVFIFIAFAKSKK